MRKIVALSAFIPALMLAVLAAPTNAAADDEEFTIKSMAENNVQVAFFSQDRHARWPAQGRAWNLNDYNDHKFNLSCVNGERICYGAWLTGNARTYWGVGADGKEACNNCCYTCGGPDPRHITLRDPIRR
jgi:hypothetical protein